MPHLEKCLTIPLLFCLFLCRFCDYSYVDEIVDLFLQYIGHRHYAVTSQIPSKQLFTWSLMSHKKAAIRNGKDDTTEENFQRKTLFKLT